MTPKWPLLETLTVNGYLSSIDLSLAQELLKGDPAPLESAAALICYLSLTARCGHLCIVIEGKQIIPDPIATWNENRYAEKGEMQEAVAKDLLQQALNLISVGSHELPHKIITEITQYETQSSLVQTPMCRMGNRFYFHRHWYYETFLLEHYHKFISHSPRITPDIHLVGTKVKKLKEQNRLLPEQAQAILNACINTLTIICGGPGTGKTYTAGILISTLWDALTDLQKEKFEIALAAPTGKAASNLQKSLLNATKGIDKLSSLQAKTLHALLSIRGSGAPQEIEPLAYDLVIVDESSMIDVRLMGALFAAMKPGARLILLGDGHQLPAVESGSLFADFVQNEKNPSVKGRVNYLNTCLRVELQGILDLADAINRGNSEGTLRLFENGSQESGIQRLIVKNEKNAAKEICSLAFQSYKMHNLSSLDPKDLLAHFNRFRLLSPLRKGPFGVEEINRLVGQELKKSLSEKAFGEVLFIAPIMLLKNDYRLELFNGETGVLIRPSYRPNQGDFEIGTGDYALFASKDGEVKRVPALLLPPFEYAYCLSVHKSQGSEFDHLLLLLPPGAECFGRELLYTAVTRARRQLSLWSDDATLSAIVQRTNCRLSGISQRIATGQQ
ncbi:MAG: exodeoxyribonuclease V subunit alpha [Parachlamydiaceae bacterium]|nr:exodeoxyribonuclease V subunit alpha [Parachlamydiaceae bacterium]